MKALYVWAIGCFLILAHQPSLSEIYECKDEAGNKRFSNTKDSPNCVLLNISPPITAPVPKERERSNVEPPAPSLQAQIWSAPPVAFISAWPAPMPNIENLYAALAKSVYELIAQQPSQIGSRLHGTSYGSAVAVTARFALTNCHVIRSDLNDISLVEKGGRKLRARLVGAEPGNDRCVVESVSGELVPVRGIRSFESLREGERVYAIGNPRGLSRTISDGLLSGKREVKWHRLIQTTAPISPGSSGGGLFDGAGNLVGITTSALKESQNINLAIPAEDYWPKNR